MSRRRIQITPATLNALVLVACAIVCYSVGRSLTQQAPVQVGPWTLATWCFGGVVLTMVGAVVIVATDEDR